MATYSGPMMVERQFTLAKYLNLTSRLPSLKTLLFSSWYYFCEVWLRSSSLTSFFSSLFCYTIRVLWHQIHQNGSSYKIHFRLNKVMLEICRWQSSAAQDEGWVYREDGEEGCQLKQSCQEGIDKDWRGVGNLSDRVTFLVSVVKLVTKY